MDTQNVSYEIREDEDQLVKFAEIVDLFVASGYYPAEIESLSSFDKIVGGMIWCIEFCNIYIDTDLLFQDNSPKIGQKISLTEKIVLALKDMRCPYTIEPHQIQGSDYIHILPVVQWLIATSLISRKQNAHNLRQFAFEEFRKRFRPDNIKNLIETQRTVLNVMQKSEVFEVNGIGTDKAIEDDIEKLHMEKKSLENSIGIIEDEIVNLTKKCSQAETDLNTILDTLNKNKTHSELVKSLVQKHENSQKEERILEETHKKKINEIQLLIKQEEMKMNEENDHLSAIDYMNCEYSKTNREIASIQRQMDQVLDNSELLQYQQRFVELYNEIARKHKETKQYFNLYNTLEKNKTYVKKEIALLTSLLENYSAALQSRETREDYLEQFENMDRSVERLRRKFQLNLKAVETTRNELRVQLNQLLESRKQFYLTVNDLNDKLLKLNIVEN